MTPTDIVSSSLRSIGRKLVGANNKQRFRFGVALRLLSAFGAITAFAFLISATALFIFGRYGAGFNRIASSSLPALVAASDLAQRSQELAASAPSLAVADSHFARRAINQELRTKLRAISDLGKRVKILSPIPASKGLDSLAQKESILNENLHKLDSLVDEKLEADRVATNFMLRLGALSSSIQAVQSELLSKIADEGLARAQINALTNWNVAVDRAIVIMLLTSKADTTIRLDRLRSEFAQAREKASDARQQLSPALVEALNPFDQALEQYADGVPNVFDVRIGQLASASAVHGALLDTKEAAAQLVTSAEVIFGDVQKDANAQSDYFRAIISDYSRLFLFLSMLCVVGAGGVFLYINRSIIRRLKTLSESMRGSVDGRSEPIPIFGNDEIGDMARAADFFVTSIEQRERGLRESLQQQTATADVLKVISRSTFDLQAVFKALVDSAARLCRATMANIALLKEDGFEYHASYGFQADYMTHVRSHNLKADRGSVMGRAVLEARIIHIHDVLVDPEYTTGPGSQWRLEAQKLGSFRTALGVPLLREGKPVGAMFLTRATAEPFSQQQIDLVTTFAAQAVIAVENTRLLNELRDSLQQQTATADVLKVISRSTFDLQPVFNSMAESAVRLCEAERAYVFRFDGKVLRAVASFNAGPENQDWVYRNPIPLGRSSVSARAGLERKTVQVADIQADPEYHYVARDVDPIRTTLAVPMLKGDELIGTITIYRLEVKLFTENQISLMETFADQAVIAIENVRLFEAEQERTRELAKSLQELRTTQDRLVQTEKLASLGQLTAGIAHEIKNPLNFVNNFSGISTELIGELQESLGAISLNPETHAELIELTDTLRANLEKVVQHGKRADAIVKSMLLHSGETSGEHRSTDINALVDETLTRAYYNARAEERGFTIKLERSFDPVAGEVDLYPREITRALLNLISNGLYAATKRHAEANGGDYEPTLVAATKSLGDRVEIRIRDNGNGIPADVKEKMFDPFFTTKPTGEGTGLGLSISHDIIVKQHGGSIEVDTVPGEFAEIRVILPRLTSR